ncbi:alpha/beta fold hydrolase [Fulvivirga lutea]|uniref:Alpha/beta hydrolase n=1 Tax=Fulvivirga lutea TaxID=2810512 RepID=A0A974WE58_9BACT|nr:hypothetical protein [Fulvivirga lutea]QSE96644.1 hypothetical protein JR347_13705 [Fulvivirga lutea]
MHSDRNNNDHSPIYTELAGKSNLLVSFGGIRQGLGIPVFEFFNSLNKLDCDKVFIRDFNQAWYHKGVSEELNSIGAIKDYLQELLHEGNYKRVCFIGNSMGGYAAILFGNLLKVDAVIAFAPQTFIGRLKRFYYWDFRWANEMKALHTSDQAETDYFDLKDILRKGIGTHTQIQIYYSKKHRLDKNHAERLKDSHDNLVLIGMSEGDHEVVKALRDNGQLMQIITEAFQ